MIVYDSGVLIAFDRDDRRAWSEHRIRLEEGLLPVVPAPVVAQVSRSSQQVSLRRALRGCQVVGFEPDQAHRVGELLAAAGMRDVVDAHVVLIAAQGRGEDAVIVTSDAGDIARLADVADATATVRIRQF